MYEGSFGGFPDTYIFPCLLLLYYTGVTKMTRKPWNSKEKQAVAKHLSGYLRSRTVPGKNAIMVLFKAEGKLLEGRSWRNIKDFIRNQARKKDPMAFLKT